MNRWLIKDEDEPLEHEASDKEIVTQVTNNVNNENSRNGGNGGNGRNNGCTYKGSWHAIPKNMMEKEVVPINSVKGGYEPGTCYECGSRKHYRNTCLKMNLAPGQVGNRLTIEGNRNSRNNMNQVSM
nr:hypothetical protein [Tanacetum cinerariifolium]